MLKTLIKPNALPATDSFIIETELTRIQVINRLQELTAPPLSTLLSMRTSEGPLFSGNVEEESFEVSLFKDTKGTILPIFNPPIIKGNWIGNKAVKIETALVQRNHQYFEGIRSFFGLLLIFSILIPFIGIAFEFNEIKNSGETTHLLESVTQAAPAILGVYILGIYIFLLLFVHIPRFMMTHGTRRSKKLLIDVFSLGNSSDEEK